MFFSATALTDLFHVSCLLLTFVTSIHLLIFGLAFFCFHSIWCTPIKLVLLIFEIKIYFMSVSDSQPGMILSLLGHFGNVWNIFWLSQRAVECVEAGGAAKCLRCTGRSQQQRMSQSSVSAAQRFRNHSGFTPVDLSQHLRSKLSFCAFFEGK